MKRTIPNGFCTTNGGNTEPEGDKNDQAEKRKDLIAPFHSVERAKRALLSIRKGWKPSKVAILADFGDGLARSKNGDNHGLPPEAGRQRMTRIQKCCGWHR